jgi:RHS repeat-associated protein
VSAAHLQRGLLQGCRTTPGAVHYYALDLPGNNVNGLFDASGSITHRYRYSPWGEAQVTSETTHNPLRFASREWDGAAGLYYKRARWYDPYLGRFISEDPIGIEGGINVYAYAGNDPVSYVDTWGLSPCRTGSCSGNPYLLGTIHVMGSSGGGIWGSGFRSLGDLLGRYGYGAGEYHPVNEDGSEGPSIPSLKDQEEEDEKNLLSCAGDVADVVLAFVGAKAVVAGGRWVARGYRSHAHRLCRKGGGSPCHLAKNT